MSSRPERIRQAFRAFTTYRLDGPPPASACRFRRNGTVVDVPLEWRPISTIALQPSRIGSLDIARGNLEGSYHDSVGDIRVLDVAGHDVNLHASGTLALNDTGQSNLKVHADTPSLEQVGKLVNQPLAGIAVMTTDDT